MFILLCRVFVRLFVCVSVCVCCVCVCFACVPACVRVCARVSLHACECVGDARFSVCVLLWRVFVRVFVPVFVCVCALRVRACSCLCMRACVCVLLLIALFVRFVIFVGCVSALRVTPGGNQVDGLPPVVSNDSYTWILPVEE